MEQNKIQAKIVPVHLNELNSKNGNLYHATSFKPVRDEIYANIDLPFDELQKKFLHHEGLFMYYVRRLRRKLLPQKLRDALNRLRR